MSYQILYLDYKNITLHENIIMESLSGNLQIFQIERMDDRSRLTLNPTMFNSLIT